MPAHIDPSPAELRQIEDHSARSAPRLVLIHGTKGKGKGKGKQSWPAAINRGLAEAGVQNLTERGTPVTTVAYWDLLRGKPTGRLVPMEETREDEAARAAYCQRQARLLKEFKHRRFKARGPRLSLDARTSGALMRGGREKPVSQVGRTFRLENANRYCKRRAMVLDHVLSQLPPGDLVIVAHSLGSVVAADLFPRLGEDHHIRCLLTIGSPLAARGTWKGTIRPLQRRFPYERVDAWVNFISLTDLFTAFRGLYQRHLLVVDLRTRRSKKIENPHKIENYVTDPVFAKVLDRALRGTM